MRIFIAQTIFFTFFISGGDFFSRLENIGISVNQNIGKSESVSRLGNRFLSQWGNISSSGNISRSANYPEPSVVRKLMKEIKTIS